MPRAARRSSRNATSCHSLDRNAESVGPSLFGMFGRKAGAGADFRYSPAMKRSGITWTRADARHVHRRSAGGGAGQPHALCRDARCGRPRRPDRVSAEDVQLARPRPVTRVIARLSCRVLWRFRQAGPCSCLMPAANSVGPRTSTIWPVASSFAAMLGIARRSGAHVGRDLFARGERHPARPEDAADAFHLQCGIAGLPDCRHVMRARRALAARHCQNLDRPARSAASRSRAKTTAAGCGSRRGRSAPA